MLNWEKIYELNDYNNKKAGTTFEKLVLNYLSCVYRKYSWENTQSSWDNNRDFISLVLDNIWGEAKYKKNSSSLEKKDVDPTMISGFLDGRIELVFIITNGKIPQTISERINETGKKCGFTIVCITQAQLEYWLIAHPEQYKIFFEESLPDICQMEAVSIENVRLENTLESNFESSYIQPEFIVNSICNLCITFSCNIDLECIIVEKEEYPFRFINEPKILLSPGLQQKCFPVKLIRINNEPIIIEFRKSDDVVLSYVLDARIVNSQNPILVYSCQESIKIEICSAINILPQMKGNNIIAIQGQDGYGKTFLMKELAKDLSFSHVVAVLQCETSYCKGINSMKLCQMIMYFNYGDIYQNGGEFDRETINYYKYLLINNNDSNTIENDLLTDIFEGCFDRIIAYNIISKISKENPAIIKKSYFARKHILLIDDIYLFSREEANVFESVLYQLKYSCNNSILLFSDKRNWGNIAEFESYRLEGLTFDDIKESLKQNWGEWKYNAFYSLIQKMPHDPERISELVCFLKDNSVTNLSSSDVNQYITKLYHNKLTDFKFDVTTEEKNVLFLIFSFSKGIDKKLLHAAKIDDKILKSLYHKRYIIYFKERYLPCVDYFQYSYINQQKYTSFNNQLSEYLSNLLNNSYIDPFFDVYQAQILLIQCNYNLYLKVKETYKTKMMEYIKKGNYKAAMLYGETFCFDMLNDNIQSDLDALFSYGIALIHCDAQRRAIDVFTFIKNHSERNTLSYYKASAELLNNKYSRFQIKDVLQEAIVLKRDIYSVLRKEKDENSLETHQLRIAYSTCMNRMMMIYFLKDNNDKAYEIYNEFLQYHSRLPQCIFSEKYNSMLQEWKMDYARGMMVYDLQSSINLNKECHNAFSANIDFRRKVLCKIDQLFFDAILNNDYDNAISELIRCKQELEIKGIVSESMKATIRITYCRLMKYACIPEFDDISLLTPFVDEIYADIFSTQLESHIITQGRTAYLLNNLLAVLHIVKNDLRTADKMLQYGIKLIQDCGEKYRQLIEHNCNHLKDIKKIKWYFYNNTMSNDTYYLDSRVW